MNVGCPDAAPPVFFASSQETVRIDQYLAALANKKLGNKSTFTLKAVCKS